MNPYRIPFEAAESEFAEKRSRFISHIWPITSEEAAQAHIREMKSKYYDARHNCWCYRLGESIMRYSDDGEPQGTAGQPMLKVFERENITDVVCVVTRYFGGILLGAGGLTRAYAKGAKDALIRAGVSTMGLWARCEVSCAYGLYERVRQEIAHRQGQIDDTAFGADVLLKISLLSDRIVPLQMSLTELSAGVIQLVKLSEEYRPGSREDII